MIADLTAPEIPLDFAELFNAAPGNYLVLDSAFRIQAVTDAYLTATKTERRTIVGKWLFDVFPDNPHDPMADGVVNLRDSLERVLASRQPDRMPIQKYDIPLPDGSGGFEVRYWRPLNTPVLRGDGSVCCIIHWVEDVTDLIILRENMQREQASLGAQLESQVSSLQNATMLRDEAMEANKRLGESERRYRFLADAVPQLVWTATPAGSFNYVNERWLKYTRLPADSLLGDGWLDVVHDDDRTQTREAWVQAVQSGAVHFQTEHRLRMHDGSWRWMLTTAMPYRQADGSVTKWFGSSTDIHDRVLGEEQIRVAQRLQSVGKLAGGMAHEVNNMMSAVLGFGELVIEALGPLHPQRADVEEMIKAGSRAAQVTRQLLAFSRQQVLDPTVVDLNVIVSDLGTALRRIVGSDRRLDIRLSVRPVHAIADRGQIEQVLINLIANARDATATNGVVGVETDFVHLDAAALRVRNATDVEPGEFVRMVVRDDGAGMLPDVVGRAFEPFFTTKPVGEGTGLGLSMVHGIVQQSGGFVFIETARGSGTSVSAYLPIAQAGATASTVPRSAKRGRGEHVLVVEDEAVVRTLVTRALEISGYVVHASPNGSAALQFLAGQVPMVDLVLTDLVMPNINGQQLAVKIGELYPTVPVLFMSAYTGDEIQRRGLLMHDVAFVQKPFTLERLATAVRDRLDAAGLERRR
ncbi:MAG: PAS domain-containing protein [Phycisphaerae bacterium]|nr:PAS domain-containing protein [Gemmatimonadaceae bacterium]